MYTALLNEHIVDVLPYLDAITVTLHDKDDIPAFEKYHGLIEQYPVQRRLYVFDDIPPGTAIHMNPRA
jgi:hypothetical protein